MRARFVLPFALALTFAACSSNTDSTAEGFGRGHALPRLISETAALTPGETGMLGVTFDIEPGWYLYWNGTNDTGYPISVRVELPHGYTAGEIEWPAPERHVSPGNILDHIYTDEVTLLLPVHVPADAKPGSYATVQCRVEWLACREACVPGKGNAAITLPVARGGTDLGRANTKKVPPDAERRFEEARARLPVPAPEGGAVAWRWKDRSLQLEAGTAGPISFYPGPESAYLDDLIGTGVSDSGTLSLRLAEDPGSKTAVSGVLEVEDTSTGEPRFYALEVPLPGSG